MSEYIDRDAVFHAMKMDIRPPFAVVRDFPAADVVPVVHGRWELHVFEDKDVNDPRFKCSACGSIETPLARHNYCPNCGAKMDGKETSHDG